MRSLAILLAVTLSACGARTTLDLEVDRDAATPEPDLDAGDDAGRDAGRDAGEPETVCRRDADCAGAICRASPRLRPADLEPLPLACGALDPARAAAGAPCTARDACDRGLCALAGTCLLPCASDGDCAPGERCREIFVRTASSALQPLSACAAVVTAPAGVIVEGPEPGPALGDPGAVALDVLPGLAPAAHVVWIATADSAPVIQRVLSRDAGAAVVFDAFAGGPGAPAPLWGLTPTTITDIVTVLYPNGPSSPLSPDGFTFELTSLFARGTTERVVMRRDGGGTVLDVDAYLVGGGGWTAPEGESPEPLRRAMRDVRDILSTIGITLGEVRVHELVGELRDRYSILEGTTERGAPPELDDLYRLSAGAPGPSVHVFFVREIEGALGIASGIPGPQAMPGNGASGVAIAVDLLDRDMLGGVIVHEIGHFAGLFHTSEYDGTVNDPLPDTGECRQDRDVDGDGFLAPFECAGAGADNVMFWAGEIPNLSAQQGEIMRRAFYMR